MEQIVLTPERAEALRHGYNGLVEAEPRIRLRDAGDRLGVPEAALVAAQVDGAATRLGTDWPLMLEAFKRLGTVMVLTRNESCVHEKVGAFEEITAGGPHGLVLGADIDLRINFARWHHGFAVEKPLESGDIRRSLQFFDQEGTAVFKLFLRPESDRNEYDAFVEEFADPSGNLAINLKPLPAKDAPKPDAEIDRDGLRAAWEAMKDTHDFVHVLKKYKTARTQAHRLIGDDFAYRVPVESFETALERAKVDGTDIMIFVGSPGCIQIHTGPVETLKRMGPWFNVLDPGFNLHLRTDRIAEAWIVKKPTEDGIVTSLEIFDETGLPIAYMFGRRKPGEAELESWRAIAASLPRAET